MKPIEFKGMTGVLASDQPQYLPLPVKRLRNDTDSVVSCWYLTDEDIAVLVQTRKIWVDQWTFGNLLQPQMLSLEEPTL